MRVRHKTKEIDAYNAKDLYDKLSLVQWDLEPGIDLDYESSDGYNGTLEWSDDFDTYYITLYYDKNAFKSDTVFSQPGTDVNEYKNSITAVMNALYKDYKKRFHANLFDLNPKEFE